MATFWGDVSTLSSVSSNEQALFTPPLRLPSHYHHGY